MRGRQAGACHDIFSAGEIERRPRGASPASQLPHLFRASYSCPLGARPLAHGWIWMKSRIDAFGIKGTNQGGQR